MPVKPASFNISEVLAKDSIISTISFSFNSRGILGDVFFRPPYFKGTAEGAFKTVLICSIACLPG